MLAEQVRTESDPINNLKLAAVGLGVTCGILWIIVGVVALFYSPSSVPLAPGTTAPPSVPLPITVGFTALAVATSIAAVLLWTAAGHRALARGLTQMIELKLSAQDEQLNQLTTLAEENSSMRDQMDDFGKRANARDTQVGELIEALGRHSSLLEQGAHRPARGSQGRQRRRGPRQPGEGPVITDPVVVDLANKISSRIGSR